MPKELEQVELPSRAAWRAWLTERHTQAESIWAVTFKKGHPNYMPYVDFVEELLCFGWIDGQAQKVDAARTMHLCAPRKKGSVWSAVNKRHILRLEAAGLIMPAGLARIEEAKRRGDWEQLDAADSLVVPDDLQAALARFEGAEALWASFPPSTRRFSLTWITLAKRPETRAKRVEETARLTAEGKRPR
jgi:uncharacterized protein YdeI (YjbR/CyaY-like superfamily)